MTIRFGAGAPAPAVEPITGREATVQDVFAAAPGRVVDGSVGPRHPLSAAATLKLLLALGVTEHRFSVAWARVLPDGNLDRSALDGYRRWADTLRDNGIEPWVELYHHDLPLSLMMEGGWLERSTAERFGDYALDVARSMSDTVQHWITLSDPFGHQAFGHAVGLEAPGLTLIDQSWPVTHHLLLGHAAAVEAVRAATSTALVGLSNRHGPVVAASPEPADRRATQVVRLLTDRQFTDPILLGRYPRALAAEFESLLHESDLERIAAPLDFYGVEHVAPVVVAAAPGNRRVPFTTVEPAEFVGPPGAHLLADTLQTLRRRYPTLPPLVVADRTVDHLDPDDHTSRVDHVVAHREAAADAGALAHFHHSLVDGWTGAEGFTRFPGLATFDAATGSWQLRPGLTGRFPRGHARRA